MSRKGSRREPCAERAPEKLDERKHEQRFARGHEGSREHIAWPVRTEIDTRVADDPRDNEVEPAPGAEEQRAAGCDDDVVRHVTRGKRWSGFRLISLIGITNRRFLEERH